MASTDALKSVIKQTATHGCYLSDWWSWGDEPDVSLVWVYARNATVGLLVLYPDRLIMLDKRSQSRSDPSRVIVSLSDPEFLETLVSWLARFKSQC